MRLNPLAFLLSQTPLSPPPPSTSSNASPPTVDVAIVGAGLSGLSAAHHLLRAGLSVTVLEARDRVGGKVHNRALNITSDAVTELGAAFVGPTQDNVLQTLSRLNLSIFPQHLSGKSITISSGERIVFSPPSESGPNDGLSGLGPESDSALTTTLSVIDSLASELDPSAPWLHPSSRSWDQLSISSWLTSSALLPPETPARKFFETVIETIFSASTHELSLLYLLTYSSSAGNILSKGTFTRLVGTAGGAQESRVIGGTGKIPLALAEEVKAQGGEIELSSPVRSIVLDSEEGVYELSGDEGRALLRAKHVVVAMSPPLASRIIYDPPLTAARDQLSQRMFMGSIGKAIAVYDAPFWRDDGLSGQVVGDEGTVRVTFDASPADGRYGAILGFLEADEAREVDGLSDEEVQRRVGEDYVKYFGPKAANVKEWVIMRWDTEEFSRGGPVAVPGLGTMSEYGHALRQRVGQIYWAGTETATHWMGYMSGALESGERVAIEILRNRLMDKDSKR